MRSRSFRRALGNAALLLATCAASAQRAPITLTADYATFMYEDEATLVEIYLGVEAGSVRYTTDPAGGFSAAIPLHLALLPTAVGAPEGAADAPAWSHDTELRVSVQDTAALARGQFFLQRVRAAVPPGEYTLRVVARGDDATGRAETGIELDPVRVPDYSADDVATISGLTLATAIRPGAAPDDPFFTNGLTVVPNPNAVFGGGPVSYYAEAYGIPEASAQESYTLWVYVAEADAPRPLPGLQQRLSRPARDPDVLVGSFDVSALPSGPYYLRMAALNASNEPLVEQSKRFFVLNPDVAPALAGGEGAPMDFEERFFAVLGPEELARMLEQVPAVATQAELRQLRGLATDDDRRAFLAAFWRARDTDADPDRNRAREEFDQRLRAIERFGVGGMAPWESDRGRVVLRYGLPSDREYNPQNQNLVPHEIWAYDNIPGQGQALFVFADREMTGRYELIHSTVIGEVSAPNWEQLLQR